MLGANQALQNGDLDDVGVVDLGRVAGGVQVLPRHLGDAFGDFPGTQDAVANQRVNPVNHMVEADRIGQQLVVFFGIGEDRQNADLVYQTRQGGLVGRQARV